MKTAAYLLTISLLLSVNFQHKTLPAALIVGPQEKLAELEDKLSATRPNSQEAFNLYNETAQLLARRGNYKEADSLFTKADALTLFETDSAKVVEMNLSRANMYKEQGKYTPALQTFMDGLDFYQKCSDINGQVWVHSYLIEFYRATLNEELCLKFIKEGEELIASNTVDTRPQAYLLQAKSSYFLQFQESIKNITFEKKLAESELALSLAEASQDSYLIGLNQNGLGFLLMHNNSSASDEIEAYFESAKNHMLANERFRNYTSVLQNFSMYYTRSGSPEKAVDMTFEAIKFSKENNWNSHLGDLYRLAGEVHYELGLFKESAEFLNEALSATKASMSEMHTIELEELTTTLEKVIAERKLVEQLEETEVAQRQAENNKKALITTVVISVIFLVTAIISIILYLRLKGANTNLRTQQGIIRKTNEQLNEVVEQKNVLYKELNHRVKNNLTVLSSLIYLQEDGEKNKAQKELYQTLRQRIQSMAIIHQNLYDVDQALNINFQKYLQQLVPEITAAFGFNNEVDTNIDCAILEVNIDEAIPLAMVINELITNSFKYAFNESSQGKINISSVLMNNRRTIHYRDNGPGISDASERHEPQKLGMLLIRLMVDQLKGTLTYEGDENGVYFRIDLP